ncbi:MAG: hypothetical protein ACREBA_00525 [Nitrosotalea sp.]
MIIKAEVTCNKCSRVVRGTITVENARVVDSDGFMIFESEIVCDTCLEDVSP